MKEFMSDDTLDMPDLHSNDNDTQDKPNPLPNTLPEISEFNPHQFTSSSSEYYYFINFILKYEIKLCFNEISLLK